MPLSRAGLETVLIARVGRWLTEAGLDGTTVSGSNASLTDPIGWALRQSGITLDDPLVPTNDEIAAADPGLADQIVALAEWRAIVTAYQNFTDVDMGGLVGNIKLDQLRQAMKDRLTVLAALLASSYGILVTTDTAGGIAIGIITAGTCAPWRVR